MNKGKLIVANWKMNFLYKNAFNFCKKILLKKKLIKNKFVICPPTTLILQLSSKFKGITFGAQDCHYEKLGAYTGDISALMLKDINCKHVIIGHSERRKYYFEDHIILKRKIESVINAGLIPIYCIGEDINIKRKDKTKNHLLSQLLNTLPKKNKKKIIIAYEPIWSIGTGNTPTVNEIEDVNLYIKKIITKINLSYEKTSILYGGSVNKHNSLVFLDNKNIDGLLIGGASLNLNTFSSILTYK
jgi:triosephosphate isomerase|tara:strand:- start:358 stop:1089 length:732 start_codon:yes stop_codon:yes gene_type:complete